MEGSLFLFLPFRWFEPELPSSGVKLPLVTICFPTIGRIEYLSAALRSLGDQTYPAYEVLVLDNASGPAAQAILAKFAAETSGVRILRVDERLPMFANFNRGIRAAAGEYIVFFHDDDKYEPTFLEKHVAMLRSNRRAAFAGGNFDVIDGEGLVVNRKRFIKKTETWSGRYFIKRLVRRGRGDLPTPGLVFRRDAMQPSGFDESLSIHWGDFTILMRMAERWDVAVIADTLFSWRAHGENASTMAFSRSIPLRTRVLVDYCAEYTERHPDDRLFFQRLRRFVARGHNQGLAWGWLVASDTTEAKSCRMLLKASHPSVATLLRILEMLGLTTERRRLLAPAIRYIAELLGA